MAIAYCLWPMTYCLMTIAYCLLPTAYGLLPIAYCLLPTAYSPLPIAYCLLPTASCLVPTACCLSQSSRKLFVYSHVPRITEHNYGIACAYLYAYMHACTIFVASICIDIHIHAYGLPCPPCIYISVHLLPNIAAEPRIGWNITCHHLRWSNVQALDLTHLAIFCPRMHAHLKL